MKPKRKNKNTENKTPTYKNAYGSTSTLIPNEDFIKFVKT